MSDAEVLVRTDRRAFFAEIRRSVFGGHLSQEQVDGISAILDEWEAGYPKGEGDLRKLGYILGTARGEVGSHMQPIREIGRGAGHAYGLTGFYGRGFVQLTWEANYAKLSKVVGVDLVSDPDKALDPKVAAKIIIQGMLRGLFTGKRLSHYFTRSASDWVGARRIVNGSDRANEFAAYGQQFYAALVKAKAELPAPPMPQPTSTQGTGNMFGPIIAVLGTKTGTGIAIAAAAAALKQYGVTEAMLTDGLRIAGEVAQWGGLAFAAYGRFMAERNLRNGSSL